MSKNDPAERTVRDIRRKTRKQYTAEEKIRIVVSGLRGEESIAALCRREGIAEGLYYSWSKEFLEAGKKRLAGDTGRRPFSGEPSSQKKRDRAWGRRGMRYPASEKLEIIRLVEQSHRGVGSTLDKLGIPKTTFYRWYDRFLAFGEDGLEDCNSSPGRVWNRIPDDVRGQIIDLALEETQLSPRELAIRFTDTRGYFVSEASVYRLLKAHDLITSPFRGHQGSR